MKKNGTGPSAKTTIESRSIEYIPESERFGSVKSLFTVWFAANMQITAVVTGALTVIIGLPLWWAIAAVVIGNLFGAVVMALHSAQGPKLGIPQMIQSRAQFGMFGAIVPLILVLLMYIGFFASSDVLGGQALTAWLHLPGPLAMAIVSACCAIAAITGYRFVHRMGHVITILAVIGFVVLSIRLAQDSRIAGAVSHGTFELGTFLLAISIPATWQITYAPYVADYSRYLPARTSFASSFWWTYGGSVLATVWMMVFGVIVASFAVKSFEAQPVAFVISLAPHGTEWAFYILVLLGVILADTLNLYGAFMSSITTMAAFKPIKVSPLKRAIFVGVTAIIGTALAVVGNGHFIGAFENFILFLAYFLIPWTAINLVDFYVVRRERYHIASVFDVNGIYGRWNWRALVAYLIGVLVEIPFMSTSFYTGPMVSMLGNADISWILGLIVSGGVYAVFGRAIVVREDDWFSRHADAETTVDPTLYGDGSSLE